MVRSGSETRETKWPGVKTKGPLPHKAKFPLKVKSAKCLMFWKPGRLEERNRKNIVWKYTRSTRTRLQQLGVPSRLSS